MSFRDSAPSSTLMPSMAALVSASLICAGRKSSMIASSAASIAASSSRPPCSYSAIDSRRCLIIFCMTSTTIASSSGCCDAVRSSISRSLILARIRRTAASRSFSPAFIAVIWAALMVSRIIMFFPNMYFAQIANPRQTVTLNLVQGLNVISSTSKMRKQVRDGEFEIDASPRRL